MSGDSGTEYNPASPITTEGNIAYHIDAKGITTANRLNNNGLVIEETDVFGNTTFYERGCSCGSPTKITYPSGREVDMTYDSNGNLLTLINKINDSSTATTINTYTATFNQVETITDPMNNHTRFEYDPNNGNLTKIIDADNNETIFTNNSLGQVTTITNVALDETTIFSYDPNTGFIAYTNDPMGHSTSYTYYDSGMLKTATDAENNVTEYGYDQMDRLTAVTLLNDIINTQDDIITRYEYDYQGNLRKVIDANNHETNFIFDNANRFTNVTNALTDSKIFSYDTNGNLVSTNDAENQTISYTYNALNQLTRKLLPGNAGHVYQYDHVGNITDFFSPNSNIIRTYDLAGQLTSETANVGLEEGNYVILPANTVIEIDNKIFDNTNILINGVTVTINGQHTFAGVQIKNGGEIISDSVNRLDLTVGNLEIYSNSSIDVTGKGYAMGYTLGDTTDVASVSGAGGSYGGKGGITSSSSSVPNEIYGDYRNPAEFGSGGAVSNAGTAGGGLIRITANNLVLEGEIRADGGSYVRAAGSGGGVRIDVGTLSGSGLISAVGGDSDANGYCGGGGGRIAVYYADKSGFTGNIQAYGGIGYYNWGAYGYGGAGTVYLKSATQEYGDLVVDNNNRYTDGAITPLRAIGTGLIDSVVYSATTGQSVLTDNNANWPAPDSQTGALGLTGLIINPNTIQPEPKVTFEVVDNTATSITINGDMTQIAQVGDTFIGEYIFDSLTVRAKVRLTTGDDIFVLGTIEMNNAALDANALKLSDSIQLQSTDATIEVTEPLFDGHATVSLDGDTLMVNNIGSIDTLQLTNGAGLSTPSLSIFELTVNTLTIDAASSIDVTGKGFAMGYTLGDTTDGASVSGAGGSYGGKGGITSSSSSVPNDIYGDYRNPAEFGSGGAVSNAGTAGGGLIRIAANNLVLEGEIRADGGSYVRAAGSGGGVRIDVGTLSGSGLISAVGGDSDANGNCGGGGGRIAVYYADKSGFTGNIQAYGGIGYYNWGAYGYGGAGTVYLKSATQEYGDLVVDNNNRYTDGAITPLRAIGTGLIDSVVYSATTGQSVLTYNNANWPAPDSQTEVLGLTGLIINPNTIQPEPKVTFEVVDNTATSITINGDMTQIAQAGDTFIGEYIFDSLTVRAKARLTTEDDIFVLGTIDMNNAGLDANALKLSDSIQLQSTDATIEVTEPLFDGHATVSLDGDTFMVNNIGSIDTLQLTNGAGLSTPSLSIFELTVNTLTIDAASSIDVTGKGYAMGYTLGDTTEGASVSGTGGSYGGKGGITSSSSSVPNEIYGDYRNPAEFGSGGAVSNAGTAGGGLIRIAANNLVLEGEIRADGGSYVRAAGSGGGVRIDVGTLSGSGLISAVGGDSDANGYCGGGGGRIAVYYVDKSGFTGNIQAYGGIGYYNWGAYGYGGAGTVYLKSVTQEYGDLVVDNNNRYTDGAITPLQAIGPGVFDSVVYSNSLGQTILSDNDVGSAWPVPDDSIGALGLRGLMLNPDTLQAQTYTVENNTISTIYINGDITAVANTTSNYIGEYHLDDLSVINAASVTTNDDVYYHGTLDDSTGTLNAHGIYMASLFDPAKTLMLARELGEVINDDRDLAALARKINRQRHLRRRPQIPLTSLKVKTVQPQIIIDATGSNPEPYKRSRWSLDISPIDVFYEKDLSIIASRGGPGAIYSQVIARSEAPKQSQRIQLAYAEGTTVSDADLADTVISEQLPPSPVIVNEVKQCKGGIDPSYTYDLNGNRATMTDHLGSISNYQYDTLNQLTSITNGNAEITTYSYDAVGRRTGMTLNNGVTATYSYNKAGWLTDLVYELSGATTANFNYTYDNVGNRKTMTDESGLHNYTYDPLYRLTDATHPQGYNPTESFDYDNVGNRLYSDGTFSNVYNAANRLVQDNNFIYSYDKNGNTISKEDKSSGAYTQFSWNVDNQLQLIEKYTNIGSATPNSVSSYIYDGTGRRVVKDIDGTITKYIYDMEDILFELDENNTVIARYTHGPGIDEPISVERDTDLDGTLDTTYYYIADGLGSIVKLVDSSGNVVNTYVYDSFGNIVDSTENVANSYTYTGREYDSESGLYYYRARYYDANIGRFISEDPIGFRGGVNFYSYVGNSPIHWIDPFGLIDPTGPLGGAIVGGGAGAITGAIYGYQSGGIIGAIGGGIGGGIGGFFTGGLSGFITGTLGGGIIGGSVGGLIGTTIGEMMSPSPLNDSTRYGNQPPELWSDDPQPSLRSCP